MRQSDTRIPDRPDQTRFLDAWYDWHRGYRIVHRENGTDERQNLTDGNLADCTPGSLPREASDTYDEESPAMNVAPSINERGASFEVDPEDRIFDLEPYNPEGQNGIDSMRRNHTSPGDLGLEDLRHNLADARHAEEESQRALSELHDLHGQVRRQLTRAERTAAETIEKENTTLEIRRQTVRRLERTVRRLTRNDRAAQVFGTREDAQHPDFISPITTFFQRHYTRHQQQEEERRQRPLSRDIHTRLQAQTANLGTEIQDRQPTAETEPRSVDSENPNTTVEASVNILLNRITNIPEEPESSRHTIEQTRSLMSVPDPSHRRRRKRKPPILLARGSRPVPLTEGQMQINMKCNICFEQLANVVLIPCGKHVCEWAILICHCRAGAIQFKVITKLYLLMLHEGHCIMCEWCSDAHALFNPDPDTFEDDRGVRTCPACREKVSNRVNGIFDV